MPGMGLSSLGSFTAGAGHGAGEEAFEFLLPVMFFFTKGFSFCFFGPMVKNLSIMCVTVVKIADQKSKQIRCQQENQDGVPWSALP